MRKVKKTSYVFIRLTPELKAKWLMEANEAGMNSNEYFHHMWCVANTLEKVLQGVKNGERVDRESS